jgi:hypothetical protein
MPLKFDSPRGDIDAWLDDVGEQVSALIFRKLDKIAREAADLYYDSLTASGDYGVFDIVPIQWQSFVNGELVDTFAGIHTNGSVSTFFTTSAPITTDVAFQWAAVVNRDAVDYARTMPNRMKDVGDHLWNDLTTKISSGLESGDVRDRLRKVVQEVGQFSRYRAELIARTETTRAFNAGSLGGARALGSFGPVEKSWISGGADGVTRDSHIIANGQTVGINEMFALMNGQLDHPGADGPPEEVVNCVLEGEIALPIGELLSMSRARWEGECVEIVTADGVRFRSTPNHPVLTASGWKAAKAVNNGDQLVRVRHTIGDVSDNNTPPRVEELYRACSESPMSLVHNTRGMNFHGDRPNGDIEVVWPNWQLNLRAQLSEQLNDGQFVFVGDGHVDSGQRSVGGLVEGEGTQVVAGEPQRFIARDNSALMLANSVVSGSGNSATFLNRGVSEPDQVGFASVPSLNAQIGKATHEGGSGNSEDVGHLQHAHAFAVEPEQFPSVNVLPSVLRSVLSIANGDSGHSETLVDGGYGASEALTDGCGAFSGEVTFADVVDVKIESGSHWVYNLTSSTGLLWSPAGVHSNCRCSLLYLYPGDTRPDGSVVPEQNTAQAVAVEDFADFSD